MSLSLFISFSRSRVLSRLPLCARTFERSTNTPAAHYGIM